MPKGVSKGPSKGKGVSRRLDMDKAAGEGRSAADPIVVTSTPKEITASSSVPLPSPPTPPLYFRAGDNFKSVLEKYEGVSTRLMTPKKMEHLYYAMSYYDESPRITSSGKRGWGMIVIVNMGKPQSYMA